MRSKMTTTALAAPLRVALPTTPRPRLSSHYCQATLNQKHRFLLTLKAQKKVICAPLVISSMLTKLKSDLSNGDSGMIEPARILLERLYAKAQKLVDIMSSDSNLSEEAELSMNLEFLETDLQAALSFLWKKEEDLKNAERGVLQKQAKFDQTKQDLEWQEKEITATFAKQKQMEEELKKANDDLASQSRQIKELKIIVEEQGKEIASSQYLLFQKEHEMDKLQKDLIQKNEEARILRSELDFREQIICKADAIIKERETKITGLQKEVEEKEHDLANSLELRKAEQQRLKVMEADLEKKTLEWLLARDEFKELMEAASEDKSDMKKTSGDFKRVRLLLASVRSELISSQESLTLSRKEMMDEALQFEKQAAELSAEKFLLMSYSGKLKAAQLEVESERNKLRVAYAQCEELESRLSVERKMAEHLEEELTRERALVEQKTQEIALLKDEIGQKELECSDTHKLLQIKESKLVEARLQIQHMKSDMASLQLILQEKDSDLVVSQSKLAEVNHDIWEVQRLMNSKEEQLIQTTMRLWEKEEHIQTMRHELDGTKVKISEATSVIERIVQLTNKLVVSVKNEETVIGGLPVGESLMHDLESYSGVRKQVLETELRMMKESLRKKEMELLAAQGALAVKEEELREVLRRLEIREREMANIKKLMEDASGLKKLDSLAQERIGDISVGEWAIGKLHLEAAMLEDEATTSALQKLADMTRQLMEQTHRSMNFGTSVLPPSTGLVQMVDSSATSSNRRIEDFDEAKKEVVRLFALTEQLVREVGISDTELQQ